MEESELLEKGNHRVANYTHLTYRERQHIACSLSNDVKVSTIAKRLGRHRSTLYRDLARNGKDDKYSPSLATQAAKNRHHSPSNKLETNQLLNDYVKHKLEQGWTPEQISGRMKEDNEPFYVCHESIYRYLFANTQNQLYLLLPKKRKRRRKRMERKITKKSHDIAAINIQYRDENVLLRNEIGHWEGDTIRFRVGQKSCVTTLVERKSRFVRLQKNHDGKSETVINKICQVIKSMPKKLWSSLTLDNGIEFANFYDVLRKTNSKVFFCDPYSPWQRGSNENTNGRLRRHLPLTLNIDQLDVNQLQLIEDRLNNTPRKCLHYKTPREVLMQTYRQTCRTSL